MLLVQFMGYYAEREQHRGCLGGLPPHHKVVKSEPLEVGVRVDKPVSSRSFILSV